MKMKNFQKINLDKNLAYLIGFIIGDGNLSNQHSHYLITAVDGSEEFMKIYAKIFQKTFGKKPKIFFDKHNNTFVAYIHSKYIWEIFVNDLKIPAGTKSGTVRVPTYLINATDNIKSAFLSGIFDAEGSVVNMIDKAHPNGYSRIQFKVNNQKLGKDIAEMLNSLDIPCKPLNYEYPREKFATIILNGNNKCKLFLSKVGFKHPNKKNKIKRILLRIIE